MGKLRILIAHAETGFVWTMVRRFGLKDFHVMGVTSSNAALAMLDAEDFDVVLLDEEMPDADGIDVLERVKNLRPFTQVIMLIRYGDMAPAIRALERGASDFVMKPSDIHELFKMVSRAYERKCLLMLSEEESAQECRHRKISA